MKYANYYVNYMVYASLLGKSLFVAFGKSFLGFREIFTPTGILNWSFTFSVGKLTNQMIFEGLWSSIYQLQDSRIMNWKICRFKQFSFEKTLAQKLYVKSTPNMIVLELWDNNTFKELTSLMQRFCSVSFVLCGCIG